MTEIQKFADIVERVAKEFGLHAARGKKGRNKKGSVEIRLACVKWELGDEVIRHGDVIPEIVADRIQELVMEEVPNDAKDIKIEMVPATDYLFKKTPRTKSHGPPYGTDSTFVSEAAKGKVPKDYRKTKWVLQVGDSIETDEKQDFADLMDYKVRYNITSNPIPNTVVASSKLETLEDYQAWNDYLAWIGDNLRYTLMWSVRVTFTR